MAGPGAVKWLAYTSEHGRLGVEMPELSWMGRQWKNLRQRINAHVNRPEEPRPNEGMVALGFLDDLGDDAALARPALLRIVERNHASDGEESARASLAAAILMGSTTLPEYLRLTSEAPPERRRALIRELAKSVDTRSLSEPERIQVLGILLAASRDRALRMTALHAIASFCREHGFRPEMRPAIPMAIELLSDTSLANRWPDFIAPYESEASSAIPGLVTLIDHTDPEVADMAAITLAHIDRADKRLVPRMLARLEAPEEERLANPGRWHNAYLVLSVLGELPEKFQPRR